jgi:argininosuccinate lyase
MENTGRIQEPLTASARKILFEEFKDPQFETWLDIYAEIDEAHLVMLSHCGLVGRSTASCLLATISRLKGSSFAPLRNRPCTRGLYLMYEDFLIETLGTAIGGVLQTARSRNDLNATAQRMYLRSRLASLIREAVRLAVVVYRRALRYSTVLMPAYTHGQSAVPITYGHYLAGVLTALLRDIEGVLGVLAQITVCPLGANAVGGTNLPIDPARTARLLGFEEASLNSVDAVASRDLILRALSSAAILGVTLSRVAVDLLQWTTAEFGFLTLPDSLVGSSSAMPQKRNPFLLEHVKGRAASPVGAFVTAATAMHAAPFTNSISAGTEGARPLHQAMNDLCQAMFLARLVIAGAKPHPSNMYKRAAEGLTSATAAANRLILSAHMDFRSAHKLIGSAISEAIERTGSCNDDTFVNCLAGRGVNISSAEIDPARVARESRWGGGPAPESIGFCLDDCLRQLRDIAQRSKRHRESWRTSRLELDNAIVAVSSAGELVIPAEPASDRETALSFP